MDDGLHPLWYVAIGLVLVAIGVWITIDTWQKYCAEGKPGTMTMRGAEYPVHFVVLASLLPAIAGVIAIWRGVVLAREIMRQT